VLVLEDAHRQTAVHGESQSDVLAAVLGKEPDLSKLPIEVRPGIRRLIGQCLRNTVTRRACIRIWVDRDGSREPVSALPEAWIEFPQLSPDGRWLAYSSDESGRTEVWVTSFPGRERRILVSNDGGNAFLWSHDGREIFYRNNNELMAVEVKSGSRLTLGPPRTLFEIRSEETGTMRMYDIAPDGKRFVFSIAVDSEQPTQPVRQLQVVLNWFKELKRLVPTE
jgi:dipeptidyl aminopeptidase/acylaminoacyl peptidase